MRTGVIVKVTAADRARSAAIVADGNAPPKQMWQAKTVLLTADGRGTSAIMRRTGKATSVVWRWQERFMHAGVDGPLKDESRPPGKKPLPRSVIERVIELTGQPPPGEATHWTAGAMAKAVGISTSSVQRIRKAQGLKPHQRSTVELSKDPAFASKLRDIVGLYVDPPAPAVVLCRGGPPRYDRPD